eukprot:c28391_g1_i1 orf=682-2460(+)
MATSGLVLRPVKHGSIFENVSSHGLDEILSPEPIEIYVTTPRPKDSVIPLKVFSSDTIASVKMRIQAYKGFYIKKQRLVYGGRELSRDECLITDYGVTNGKVLHLVLRLSDLRNVTIKTINGEEHVFKLESTKSVRDLKYRISKKEGGPAFEEQQLVLRGERLLDETLIEDLSLEHNAVVHLIVRKSAKVKTKSLGKDAELYVTAVDPITEKVLTTGEHAKNLLRPSVIHPNHEETLQVKEKPIQSRYGNIEPAFDLSNIEIPGVLLHLLRQVKAGLERGHSPVLSSEGSGGAYFMHDKYGTDIVGVFKPMDEEPMAINNPRGLPLSTTGEGLKRGTQVGEGALREVAAYILDHPVGGPGKFKGKEHSGFAGVPPTMMVQCSHKAFHGPKMQEKLGSLQLYIHSFSNCEDMGPASFPVQEVHKICVLDIRLANTDRNGGNILVCKQGEPPHFTLVPIDHGYCLPDKFEDCTFEWLYWPQAQIPFQPATLEYIYSLDVEKDIALLRNHGWELTKECARVFRVATMLLKKGAAAGLTPYEIASMMCREFLNEKSTIEKMLEEAEESALPASSEKAFMETLSEVMDQYIQKAKSW